MDIKPFVEQAENLTNRQAYLGNFVFPDYGGLNLKNVLPQIAAVFGVGSLDCSTSSSDCLAELEGVKRVVLLIFDGLGYNRLLNHLSSHDSTFADISERGVLKPITTVFPSTTSTALTSLFSGLSPAQHQIIGYHMYSKKYGLIYNTLDMKPVYGYSNKVELAKEYACTIAPLTPVLEQNGIHTNVITKSTIIRSGLSEITHRDTSPTPYFLSSDMWTHTIESVSNPNINLSIVYYSGVDNLSHKYGPNSKEVTFELTSIEHGLADFTEGLNEQTKKETLLVITADHGIAENKQSIYLKDAPTLMQHLLLPPLGEGRATYLFCKPTQKTQFAESFVQQADGFKLASTDELINRGLFGEPINREELKEKLGDFTALAYSDKLLDYPFYEDDRASPQRGAHGGMTAEEMLVPLLSMRLSEL